MNNFKLAELIEKVIDNRGKTPPLVEIGFELIESSSLVGDRKYPNYNSISKHVTSHIFNTWFRNGHPKKNDIIVATVGANIGSVAIMGENRGCIAQNLVALRVKTNFVDPHFLFYFLFWDRTNKMLKNLDIGAAQPSIKVPHLLEIEIPLQKIDIQKKIGTILSAYDDLRENNTRRIKILEEMAQAIYCEWFVDFRFPGHEGMRMVESELGLVPEGWCISKIGKSSENFDNLRKPLSSIESDSRKGPFPYYGAQGIIDYIDDFKFEGDFLLIPEDGANLLTRNLPMVYIAKEKFWVNNHAHVIKPKSPLSLEYLFLQLTHADFSGFITGTAQPKLNQENFNRIPILVPDADVLTQFNPVIKEIYEKISLLISINQNLRRTRDLLLPKLISGEIDVSGLDIRIPEAEA